MKLVFAVVLLVVGFILLVKGADFFVDASSGIASRFGIPQLVIGLTIVAMGTSLPEAAVSITAALEENAGISIGNVVGSNILNILIILGITAIITAIPVQKSTIKYEIPFMLVTTFVLLIFGYTRKEVNLIEGIILLGMFLLYLIYLFHMTKNGENEENELEIKQKTLWMQLILLIGGGVAIILGSNLTVNGATTIARILGMDDRLIGLTIVAFGTSLPELVTSVTAARKGNADIAIGNIVGSNIFNILFVIGVSAFIIPIPFEAKFIIDSLLAIAAGILLWIGVIKTKKLTRPIGIIMLVCYALYFVYLLW